MLGLFLWWGERAGLRQSTCRGAHPWYARWVISARVHFHGPIDRRGHSQDCAVQLEPGTTVEALLRQLGYADAQVRVIQTMIGGQRMAPTRVVGDGEMVEIFVVASGG